ncbi:ATP-dependent helicase C-terminal domain-containing protein [Streptomyces aureoverticillatus]|uniref:ATP-dependent helicase C-terminal domain-containing protein n=1 Tax=Streptomyces aureoverticillatus TaxID=66871 RepID=UPI0013DA64DD|nr:ATP-dependent helicase C-terminal domain-containing protein [Streptomyces aureoverticillatus]QIB46383.1 ATP-dependent helicase [Streptomyces aureoverticillatus]
MIRDAALKLPVREALPALRAALEGPGAAVLCAPPGTGKTTLVPLALAGLVDGGGDGRGPVRRVVVAEPRRIAARAAARRMAWLLGEKVGGRVGYTVRGERVVGPRARVEVVTTGVLLQRLQRDQELAGVDAVVIDECHERHLDADTVAAFLIDVREALRPELKLVAASATTDAEGWARVLGGAPVVEAAGTAHPVEVVWAPPARPVRPPHGMRVDPALLAHVAATVRRALRERDGDVLCFLPGVGEIGRVAGQLGDLGGVEVLQVHGRAPAAVQDAVLAGGERRRVVLATSVAESSLTVPGVRVVVDSGLAREPRVDHARGLSSLTTVRASQAAGRQRAGRAGREAPGAVYRCWAEAEDGRLSRFPSPEIKVADLTAFALQAACWGDPGAGGLALLDAPPAGAMAAARDVLTAIGAVDGATGRVTDRGVRLSRAGVHPRLARALLDAAPRVGARRAAEAVALLSEEPPREYGDDLASALRAARRGADAYAARWRSEVRRLTSAAGATPSATAPPTGAATSTGAAPSTTPMSADRATPTSAATTASARDISHPLAGHPEPGAPSADAPERGGAGDTGGVGQERVSSSPMPTRDPDPTGPHTNAVEGSRGQKAASPAPARNPEPEEARADATQSGSASDRDGRERDSGGAAPTQHPARAAQHPDTHAGGGARPVGGDLGPLADGQGPRDDLVVGLVAALAFPERVARRQRDGTYLMVGGTRAEVGNGSGIAGAVWVAVAVADRGVGAGHARVRLGAVVDEGVARAAAASLLAEGDEVAWVDGGLVARHVERLGAVELVVRPLRDPDPVLVREGLLEGLRREGLGLLRWDRDASALRDRLRFLRRHLGEPWPDVSDEVLLERADAWLEPELGRARRRADLGRIDAGQALTRLLPWATGEAARLDSLAPERVEVPSGSRIRVDYADPERPVLAVKLQEMFGLQDTPRVAGVPLLVHLLSPAGRPAAVTADLASFWRDGYRSVRAELRGRYPKHPWPEDPATAAPTRYTKARQDRRGAGA